MTVLVSTPNIQSKEPDMDTTAKSFKDNSYTMRFFLPEKFDIKSAPTPQNKDVSIGSIPKGLKPPSGTMARNLIPVQKSIKSA